MKPQDEHRHAAPDVLGVFVVTVSSSRYQKKKEGQEFTDESGDLAEKTVVASGHRVVGRVLISDDMEMLRDSFENATMMHSVDVVLFLGGTGVSPRDITVDAIRPRFEKELEGFGERLRAVSYAKMGVPALLSRATAGVTHGKLILCLPGSPDGVRTALELFMPDLAHVIYLARERA
jgi:molybdopterin adenylyltransferase